jgi:hypothetical protein
VRELIGPPNPECLDVKDRGVREPEGSRSSEGYDGIWLELTRPPPGYKVSESALLDADNVASQDPPCCLLYGQGNKAVEGEGKSVEISYGINAGASFSTKLLPFHFK